MIKFPAVARKLNFVSQSITTEIQGIEISGIIVWTVLRSDDGPLKAYSMLGSELEKPDAYHTNSKLVAMANAICRSRIANSTIDNVITQRKEIRDTLLRELLDIVKGWGIWIETIEITDVKILSSSLFTNLQSKFREQQK